MNILFEKKRVLLPPICKKGTDAMVLGDWTDINSIPSNAESKGLWYPSDATIILGMKKQKDIDSNREFQGATATWQFDVSRIPSNRFKKLISADLHINTFRTHAGININYEIEPEVTENEISQSKDFEIVHICFHRRDNDNGYKEYKRAVKLKAGNLFINDKRVDNIDIVSKMPTGRYYGFNKVGPYPVIPFIIDSQKRKKSLVVTINVDPGVYWDIDEVRLDSLVIESYDLRQIWWIVLGALISYILGDLLHITFKYLSIIFERISLLFTKC